MRFMKRFLAFWNDGSASADFRLDRPVSIALARLLLIQPILVFELSRQIGLGQVLKIFVGERVELELEAAGDRKSVV